MTSVGTIVDLNNVLRIYIYISQKIEKYQG